MPDIEDYIDQKIPIKPIDKELLADIIKPEKRTPRPKLAPNKRTKPRPKAS
jgi:ATP-dependent RNA helicase RhlB